MSLNTTFHRLLILAAVFLTAPASTYSQKDSVWVILTYTNHITDGNKSTEESTTSQKTFTLDWDIIRELKFDSLTGEAYAYKVYFYDDSHRMSSVEEYSFNDSLISGMKYGYDNQDRINEIQYYVSESSHVPVFVKREVYSYFNDTLKKSVITYNAKDRKIYSSIYSYDPQKKENYVKSAYRIATDGIKKSTERHILNDQGSTAETEKSIKFKNGQQFNLKSTFEYNDRHLLKSEKKYREGRLKSVINYEYYATDRLKSIEERNKDDKLVSYKHFDYRIFYIDLGKNKSLLE